MAKQSGINWTDYSWGPWIGCTPVSAGCDNCYAKAFREGRLKKDFSVLTRTSEANWRKPLGKTFEPGSSVFVCPQSDFFHHDADGWRDEAWGVIAQRSDLNWLLCTKRPERIKGPFVVNGCDIGGHLWLGVTVENGDRIDRIRPLLKQKKWAGGVFVSIEPMLSVIDIPPLLLEPLNGVIVGGETGPNARPIQADWVRSIRDQCAIARVPFFLKSFGDNAWDNGERIAKRSRFLDGVEHNELPWRVIGSV